MTGKLTSLIAMSLTLFLFGCGGVNEEQKLTHAKYVKVEKVSNQHFNDKMVFNGVIKEKSLNSISFRIGGPLKKFLVNQGDYVKKGDLIAKIDKRDYQLQVQSTKAQYEQVSGEYERYKALFSKNKIPANTYEKIESGYLLAKTAYENAVNQLNDSELRAPFSGYIHEKFVENFQTIGPGQAVVSIVDLSKLEIVISIPENQLSKIKNSTSNFLSVKNANISELPVSILSIGEKAKNDGLFEMRFELDNQKSLKVFPGMSAEISMLCSAHERAIDVPISAVFYNESKTWVWVLNNETKQIKKREVQIKNIHSGGRVEVLSGLQPNEIIVTAGVNSLLDNQLVEPLKTKSSTNIGGLL